MVQFVASDRCLSETTRDTMVIVTTILGCTGTERCKVREHGSGTVTENLASEVAHWMVDLLMLRPVELAALQCSFVGALGVSIIIIFTTMHVGLQQPASPHTVIDRLHTRVLQDHALLGT